MKHRAPQFEMPGTECAFNLAGELRREEPPRPRPTTKPDLTPDLFASDPEAARRDAIAQRAAQARIEWREITNAAGRAYAEQITHKTEKAN